MRIKILSFLILLLLVAGCKAPQGIHNVDDANRAGEAARRLTAPAYQAISDGHKPSDLDLENLKAAEKLYDDLIKFEPSTWGPWLEKGKINVILADYRKAEDSFNQFFALAETAEEAKPQIGDARFLLGTGLLNMDRADEALRQADLALEVGPDVLTYMVFRAQCLIKLGKNAEAKQQLLETLEKYPDSAEALDMYKSLPKPK